MKRLIAMLLCAMLLMTAASALALELPEGAFYLKDAPAEIPEGLELMYALMTEGTPYPGSTVDVMCMKNGYVLASYAQTPVTEVYTAEQLKAFQPQIQASMEKQGIQVLKMEASTEKIFGTEVACFNSGIALKQGEHTENVLCGTYLFYRDGALIEFTAVLPWMDTDADPALVAARDEDIEALDVWLNAMNTVQTQSSLYPELMPSTAVTEVDLPESELWTDPQGWFRLQIPVGSVVLTPASTDEEIAAAHDRYVMANNNAEGLDKVFENITGDIRDENGTVIFTPDFKGTIELYHDVNTNWQGITAEMLGSASQAESIRSTLEEENGFALLMVSGEQELMAGKAHARIVYALRCGGMTYKLAVLPAVENDVLWEVDISGVAGTDWFDSLYRLVVDTMEYLDGSAQ